MAADEPLERVALLEARCRRLRQSRRALMTLLEREHAEHLAQVSALQAEVRRLRRALRRRAAQTCMQQKEIEGKKEKTLPS